MRRTPMPRGKGFQRKQIERTPPSAPTKGRGGVVASAAGMNAAIEKTPRYESPALREMANGQPCLLNIYGICCSDPATVVGCHSNWQDMGGKGGARKADDFWMVWGCFTCHTWLDSEGVAKVERRQRFLGAMHWQREAWLKISRDPGEPERMRRAAAEAVQLWDASAKPEP